MQKNNQESNIRYFWRSDSNPFSDLQHAVWQPYDLEDIIILEEGFQKYLTDNKFEEVQLKKASSYKVNFSTWTQFFLNDTTRQRSFKREASIIELKDQSTKRHQNTKQTQFFWRSDPNPFSPKENALWSPYNDEDSKFLEASFQKYSAGNGLVIVKLGDKYHIDFKHMIQVSTSDPNKQRPIKRENNSKLNDNSILNNSSKPKSSKKYYCSYENCKTKNLFSKNSCCPEHPHSCLEIPKFLTENFDFRCKLGSGSFGFVFQVFDHEDQELKALKLIKQIDFKDGDVTVLKKINHRNIIRYFRSKSLAKDVGFLLMELCDSDLNALIRENKLSFEEKEKIVHRDLKPSNILICNGVVKISDFGTAKQLQKDDNMTLIKGTSNYLPPEVLIKCEKNEEIDAALDQDMFSLGIITHQFFNDGKHPFGDKGKVDNIKNGKYIIDYQKIKKNSELDDIIKGCLEVEPKKRLSISEVLEKIKVMMKKIKE